MSIKICSNDSLSLDLKVCLSLLKREIKVMGPGSYGGEFDEVMYDNGCLV